MFDQQTHVLARGPQRVALVISGLAARELSGQQPVEPVLLLLGQASCEAAKQSRLRASVDLLSQTSYRDPGGAEAHQFRHAGRNSVEAREVV